MNNFSDLILKYQSGEMSITERKEFNRDFFLNSELRKEYVLQEKLDKVMKESLFLEGFESDPNLIKAEILAQKDIENYMNSSGIKRHKTPINHFDVETEVEIRKRIAKAEVEMVLSGIDDLSETWVREFEKRRPELHHDLSARKIVEYVNTSDSFSESAVEKPASGYRVSRRVVLQLAAAVFVLSFLLIKALTPGYSGDSAYKHFYEPLEANSFQLRGSMQDANAKLQEGVTYYLSQNYTKAEPIFTNLRKVNKNMPEVLLYSGLNEMGQNNYPAAISSFNDLLSNEDQFVPEAQWYLGLCYLKTGEVSKARSLLVTLSETEGIYRKKAHSLLKTLNR